MRRAKRPDSRLTPADAIKLAGLVRKYGSAAVIAAVRHYDDDKPKRGRPKSPVKSLGRSMLAESMEVSIDAFIERGDPDPIQAAIREWAELEGRPEDTIRRYRREGLASLAHVDQDLLREFSAHVKGGWSPVEAKAEVARRNGKTVPMVERAIARAQRRKNNT